MRKTSFNHLRISLIIGKLENLYLKSVQTNSLNFSVKFLMTDTNTDTNVFNTDRDTNTIKRQIQIHLELEVHALESGGSLDAPHTSGLRDLHHLMMMMMITMMLVMMIMITMIMMMRMIRMMMMFMMMISITGVDTVAAFLRIMFTSSACVKSNRVIQLYSVYCKCNAL